MACSIVHLTEATFHARIIDTPRIHVTLSRCHEVVMDFLNEGISRHEGSPYRQVVGFDVISIPSMMMGIARSIQVLSLSIGGRILILHRPFQVYNLLQPVFENANRIFVGFNVLDALQTIQENFGFGEQTLRVEIAEFLALGLNRPELARASIRQLSMAALMKDVNHPSLDGLSWYADYLTDEQVLYCSINAYIAERIGTGIVGEILLEPPPPPPQAQGRGRGRGRGRARGRGGRGRGRARGRGGD